MNCEISRRICPTLSRSATLTLAFALAIGNGNALGLGSDTVFITGNAGVSYDTNVFRLSPDLTEQQVQLATGGSSDKGSAIYSVGASISADVPYSRQRFQANLNVTDSGLTLTTSPDQSFRILRNTGTAGIIGTFNGLAAGTALLSLIAGLKILESQTRRDRTDVVHPERILLGSFEVLLCLLIGDS